MKLETAIELLNDFLLPNPDPEMRDLSDALKMSISALQLITIMRQRAILSPHELLRGETPE